jgi:hypothetical protein
VAAAFRGGGRSLGQLRSRGGGRWLEQLGSHGGGRCFEQFRARGGGCTPPHARHAHPRYWPHASRDWRRGGDCMHICGAGCTFLRDDKPSTREGAAVATVAIPSCDGGGNPIRGGNCTAPGGASILYRRRRAKAQSPACGGCPRRRAKAQSPACGGGASFFRSQAGPAHAVPRVVRRRRQVAGRLAQVALECHVRVNRQSLWHSPHRILERQERLLGSRIGRRWVVVRA